MISSWDRHRLEQITTLIKRGRAPSYADQGALVINQKCIQPGNLLDTQQARRTDNSLKPIPDWAWLTESDTLVNSTGRGTLGRAAFVGPLSLPMTADSHVSIVRPDPQLILPEFLGIFLASVTSEIESLQSGSTSQTELSPTALGQLNVPVPPLPVQRRIVDLMTHLDNHIANLVQEDSVARRLLEAQLAHEFRFIGAREGVPLGNLVKIHHGWAFPSAGCRDTVGDGTPRLIRIGDFARSRSSSFDATRSQEFTEGFPDRFLLSPAELLVAMTCQTPDGAILGWPMLVPEHGGPYLHNQRIGRVEVIEDSQTSANYLFYLFASNPFNAALRRTAAGTKILHTSPDKIGEIRVQLPSLDHQIEVALRLDALNELLRVLRVEIDSVRDLREVLLGSVLSAELELSESLDELLTSPYGVPNG